MEATLYLSFAFVVLYLAGLGVRRCYFLRDRAQMEERGQQSGRVVAREGQLALGAIMKFWLICGRYRIDCFLLNDGERYQAYINRCRHMATPLDFVRNQFHTDDRRRLVCMMHGAIYEPRSGLCVDGPCKGLSLHRLPVSVENGEVWVGCPQGNPSFLVDLAE